jgi:hypothetical protein
MPQQAYEKRYALCKLRYVAWGLSELRSRGLPKNARFQARVESGQPLPRLTVRKANESDPDGLVAVIRVRCGRETVVVLCLDVQFIVQGIHLSGDIHT